jgi:hypothetical protein
MGNSTIPTGQRRLNLNIDADVFDALTAEARINARKTGPHAAKVLTDHIRRKQSRMSGKGAR